MTWPWVSRLAYDLLVDERDRLRAQNDKLVDDMVRLQRARQGLREAPRPEKAKPDQRVPPEIRELYEGFQSKAVKDELDRQALEMRAQGTPWSEIQRILEAQMEEAVEA